MEKIIFSPPDISDAEIEEVVATLKSGWLTTGPRTKELERQIAEYCNAAKAVCLNSATACMEMTLRMLGVGPGDEVITTAYTYTATCSVICHVGATPVLVDTGKDSFEIDYDSIADKITEKTKVIMPVDIAGIMCDYDKIFAVLESKKHLYKPDTPMQKLFDRVIVLADSAHGYGASYNGKMSGEVADFTSFSFHAVKNFTTGEGGAVVWKDRNGFDNDEIYRMYQLLSLHGQSKDALAKTKLGAWEYDIEGTYFKCNMTDIMAAIGLGQMKRYDKLLERRREILDAYTKGIESDEVSVLKHDEGNRVSSRHLCLVRLIGKDREFVNKFITEMAKREIPLNVHYKPLPLLSAYKNIGFDIKDYPNAYEMYENEVTLPLHTKLTDEQIEYIINNFNIVLKELNKEA